MSELWPSSLVLAGAGKMGGALLRGWLAKGLAPETVRIVDPYLGSDIKDLCRDHGISLEAPTAAPEVLVLAIKPQMFAADPGGFANLTGPQTLVVSILAGKTIANLRAGLPAAGCIVRAMPNLPSSIGRGAAGLAGESGLTARQQGLAINLLRAVGEAEWFDESHIDAVTAVSGSGPAYVFLLAEALAAAGHAAGLPADKALMLARATVVGAGAMMEAEPDRPPQSMREAVTSPGGTTAAALDVLRGPGGLEALMIKAVEAAKRRAAELAG